MTNIQLYLSIGVPLLFNAGLIGVLVLFINAKFDAVDARFEAVDAKFDGVDGKFEGVNDRFDAIDKRFDDMRDLWRAELHRVEEVLDARLKHLKRDSRLPIRIQHH